MRIEYNTNNYNGSMAKQLGIVSAQDAVDRGLAESIGDWNGHIAAFQCSTTDQSLDIAGYDIVLEEV